MVYLFHLFKYLTKGNEICGWRQGKHYEWHENGKICSISNLKDDYLHGKHCEYYENTIHSISNYENGNLYGVHHIWHENGIIWNSCTYFANLLHGRRYWWYHDAKVSFIAIYKHGEII